jgi:putative molybdopterin biosynthesis protein
MLTASEVAARFKVTGQRVHELARLGLLPSVRLGRSVRFDPAVIEEWIRNGGRAYPGGWRRDAVVDAS